MIFKPMKPEEVLQLLKGQEDIITKPIEEAIKFVRHLSCPSCGQGNIAEVVNARKPFSESNIVPNFLGRCSTCGIEFEPYTGIQITMPKP